jgi:hypothetical protein
MGEWRYTSMHPRQEQILRLSAIKLRILGHMARNLVSILTELSRFLTNEHLHIKELNLHPTNYRYWA